MNYNFSVNIKRQIILPVTFASGAIHELQGQHPFASLKSPGSCRVLDALVFAGSMDFVEI
jgi:hypothetical protein